MLSKNWFLVTLLCLFTILLSYISSELLNVYNLTLNSLAEQITRTELEKLIETRQKWQWIGYLLIPLLLLIKITVISGILDIGCIFFGKEIKYKKLFNIVIKAEFVFLFVIVFKTVWFYSFQTNYNLEDLQHFYPLSALNIIGYEELQPWFIYPFQVLNIFELAYWFILAYLIGKELNENTDKGFSIVASSYGVSLLIWVAGVMFFILNMS